MRCELALKAFLQNMDVDSAYNLKQNASKCFLTYLLSTTAKKKNTPPSKSHPLCDYCPTVPVSGRCTGAVGVQAADKSDSALHRQAQHEGEEWRVQLAADVRRRLRRSATACVIMAV